MLAAILATVILGLAALSTYLPIAPVAGNRAITPEHSALFGMYDSRIQSRSHRVLATATALAFVALAISPPFRGALSRVAAHRLSVGIGRLLAVNLPVVILLLAARPFYPFAVATLVTAAIFAAGRRFETSRWLTYVAGTLVAAYATVTLIPGFLALPDLSDHSLLDSVEMHYSMVVSEGDRLAHGLRFFDEIIPHYGLLTAFLLAVAQKLLGFFTFGDHIRIVQMMQVVFCAAAFAGYFIWSRRRVLATGIAFIPAVLAAAGTQNLSVYFPNQSGFRSAGLPLGLLLLIALRPRGATSAWVLGLGFGALALLNVETGIVVGAGYLVYIACSLPSPSLMRLFRALVVFVAGAAVTLLLFAAAVRIGFGHFPIPVFDRGTSLARFSAGYAGLKIYFHITWVLILCHALFELLASAARAASLDEDQKVRAAIAGMIVVWFGYFFNRPHPWNLWTFYFLYGFFVIDFVRPEALVAHARWLRAGRLSIGFAIVTLFVSTQLDGVIAAAKQGMTSVSADAPKRPRLLSDVGVPEVYAQLVERKAAFLRTRSQDGPVLYFTSSMYLMPLVSGVFPHLPVSDVFVDSFTVQDFENLAEWIEKRSPDELLFDDPAAGWDGSHWRQQFMRRFKDRLSPLYVLSTRADGWEVWRRRGRTSMRRNLRLFRRLNQESESWMTTALPLRRNDIWRRSSARLRTRREAASLLDWQSQ